MKKNIFKFVFYAAKYFIYGILTIILFIPGVLFFLIVYLGITIEKAYKEIKIEYKDKQNKKGVKK